MAQYPMESPNRRHRESIRASLRKTNFDAEYMTHTNNNMEDYPAIDEVEQREYQEDLDDDQNNKNA
mgnify:CR=1 FL=1